MNSTAAPSTNYFDVFINHRGKDVELTLATNIRDKISAAGVHVFLYVDSLQLGDAFPAKIEQAMCSASVHLAIFSIHYAESPWCLSELAFMFHTGKPVIPIFYHVQPSDLRWVRQEKGVYAAAFSHYKDKGKYSPDLLEAWMVALENASFLNGIEVRNDRDEGMLLKNIVNMVSKILPKPPLLVAQKPVGLDDIVLDFERETAAPVQNVQIMGIVGVGGAGHSSSLGYIRRLTDLASTFNWGILVFILGSYGLILSNPVFWLCWSILVTEAVIFYSIRPYWNCIENPLLGIYESKNAKRPYRPSEHRRAGAVILKVGMSIALNTMLLSSQDIAQRQIKILLFVTPSIILIEGIMPILIVREELRYLMRIHSGKGMHMMCHITEGHDWKAAHFLTPSVLNAMIGVTAAIVLGGNLGSVMPETPFWIFISIFVVDLLAEVIHRFDCGKRSLSAIPEEDLPKISRVAIILRLVVEVCLCYLMTREICQESYFPSHMDANACNGQCQVRSKQLLITMVVLGGFQAAGTVVTPLFSCVIGPHCVPSILLSAVVFIADLLQVFTYKLFNGSIYVIKIICTQNHESYTRLPV